MIKLNDEIIVKIEKLIYGGYSLARWGDEKFVIFVQDGLPDEKLKVQITSLNKKFARAKIVEIIESSPNRIKPFCPMYNACDSCNYQIADYNYLTEQKQKILEDIFNDIKFLPFEKSPKTNEYRHKVQYPARQTKNSKRILMGYFKNNSHELVNIKYCPIQPNIINEITEYIRQNFPFDCYSEKTHNGLLKNVLYRISKKQDILLTFVISKNCNLDDFSKELNKKFPQIKGIFININPKNNNKILGDITNKIQGDDYITETLENKKYKIGATSFFQINPYSAVKLFNIVKENIENNSNVIDCYGGVGAIGIFISDKVSKITLIEENKEAVNLAKENYKLNNIENFEIFEGDAKKHLENIKTKYDCAIIDPPRSGCDKQALDSISKITNNIIYISCNPQTLKRDIEYLKTYGYEPEFIQGVDMFPYTYHIECICKLKKPNTNTV